MTAKNAVAKRGGAAGMLGGTGEEGRKELAPEVDTVTVKVAMEPFETATPEGTLQFAPRGAPEQVKVSVPEKPRPGAAWRLYCAS